MADLFYISLNMTGQQAQAYLGSLNRRRDQWAVTVWLSTAEVPPLFLLSPLYVAVMA
jgi:hypothetical protein